MWLSMACFVPTCRLLDDRGQNQCEVWLALDYCDYLAIGASAHPNNATVLVRLISFI